VTSGGAVRPTDIQVYVVVPPRVLLLDIAGPMEVLRNANFEQMSLRFSVTYVGPAASASSSIGLSIAGIGSMPDHLPENAWVVIPGSSDIPLGKRSNMRGQDNALEAEIVAWLRRLIRPGIRLVSICSGALLAARAGLLDGHECTTHHAKTAELSLLAPAARVKENRLFVDDRERLTSTGVTTGVDLMLYVVAQMAGHTCAVAIARHLVVYLRRGGSDPQLSPWLERRNHIHPVVHKIQDVVAADPSRDWSVRTLASAAETSSRNLSRLFNDHTRMSVTEYVNRMRVALARELLVGSRLDMETIAERAGFISTRQFRRAWGRLNHLPPSQIRSEMATAPANGH
jgi:transcriptional regulator GlxA family with amidase domain